MILENLDTRTIASVVDGAVVVFPLGATEQHGPHLGTGTDSILVSGLCADAERARPGLVLLCPTFWMGSSHHHLSFAGTLSISPETYAAAVAQIVEGMSRWGVKRLLIVNGHGGNITPVQQSLAVLSSQGVTARTWVALTTYWDLAPKAFFGAPPMQSPQLSHACEYEASMMLLARPGAVALERWSPHVSSEDNPYVWSQQDAPVRGVSVALPTEYQSSHGGMGRPDLATRSKGEHLHAAALGGLLKLIDSFATWPMSQDLRGKQG